MEKGQKVIFLLNVIFYLTVAAILFISFRILTVYLFPFIIGTVITVMIQKPAGWVSERLKIKKGICALVLLLLCYVLIISGVFCGAIKLIGYISELFDKYGYMLEEFTTGLNLWFNNLSEHLPQSVINALLSGADNILKSISTYISSAAKNAAKVTPIFVTSSIVTVVASCYISKDYDRFKASISSVICGKYKIAVRKTVGIFKNNIFY